MSAPLTRILSRLRKNSTVYLRSPAGQLSKTTLKYASGKILRTQTREFDRVAGEETNVPAGGPRYRVLVPNELLDAEYRTQASASFETNRVGLGAAV